MLIVDKNSKSIVSEAYRTLRTNIQYSSFDKEIKTILITSSEAGEGKSITTGNLALSLANDSKRVILIDCDLRKPTVHKKFKISNVSGLSEVLVGKKSLTDSIHKYNEKLHILTSGKIPPNPSEMLGSKLMSRLLAELKDVYDYVILDTPPVLAVTDSQILSTKVDGTILVVRAGVTKEDRVIEAKNALDKVKANIIGTVLNRVERSRNKYYYYYEES